MANKLELVSSGGIPHCYNRNVSSTQNRREALIAMRIDVTIGDAMPKVNKLEYILKLQTARWY